jgi:putative transposase
LSVSVRNVRGMSERRFRRTAAGVYSLGLHLVWCPK